MTAAQELITYLNSTPKGIVCEHKVALYMKKLDHEQKMEQLQQIMAIASLFKKKETPL